MNFSCKIVLAHHEKVDGMKRLYLQAVMDRRIARVSVGFTLQEKYFDSRYGRVKSSHPNAETYNTELQMVITKANNIASKCRIQKKILTPAMFREEFEHPSDELDLIGFITKQLALKSPELQPNTIKQHNTVINKLKDFRKRISFSEVNPELMQRFKNFLIKRADSDADKLMPSTVDKLLKILKHYLTDARKSGIEFEEPFTLIRIKTYKSNRMALTEDEVIQLDEYFRKPDTNPSHKKLLRYFLFSCYTGLRISDITQIKWDNIHNDILIFKPVKTKGMNKDVTVPLTIEKKYLPEFVPGNKPIFDTFSDPVSNRYLKVVAVKAGIKKNITYHTSRHTFGSLMAEGGHLPETQKMMGHGNIKTTMEYVHTSSKNLIDAKNKRFSHPKPESNPAKTTETA